MSKHFLILFLRIIFGDLFYLCVAPDIWNSKVGSVCFVGVLFGCQFSKAFHFIFIVQFLPRTSILPNLYLNNILSHTHQRRLEGPQEQTLIINEPISCGSNQQLHLMNSKSTASIIAFYDRQSTDIR